MAFRFPFQSVFHFHQSLEHQQELRLRVANQQVARAHHLIEQLDQRLRRMQECQSREIGAGTTAAEFRFSLLSEAALRQQRQTLECELLRLQKVRDEQRRMFDEVRRERAMFESLRDRQLREYQRDQARRSQRQMDDLFLLRQAYLRRG